MVTIRQAREAGKACNESMKKRYTNSLAWMTRLSTTCSSLMSFENKWLLTMVILKVPAAHLLPVRGQPPITRRPLASLYLHGLFTLASLRQSTGNRKRVHAFLSLVTVCLNNLCASSCMCGLWFPSQPRVVQSKHLCKANKPRRTSVETLAEGSRLRDWTPVPADMCIQSDVWGSCPSSIAVQRT